jgi:hypothetical protein
MVKLTRIELFPDDPLFSEGPTIFTPILVRGRQGSQPEGVGPENTAAKQGVSAPDAPRRQHSNQPSDRDHVEFSHGEPKAKPST